MLYISASGLAANAGGEAVAVPADGMGGDGSVGVGTGRLHRYSSPSGGKAASDSLLIVYQCTPLLQLPVTSMPQTPVVIHVSTLIVYRCTPRRSLGITHATNVRYNIIHATQARFRPLV